MPILLPSLRSKIQSILPAISGCLSIVVLLASTGCSAPSRRTTAAPATGGISTLLPALHLTANPGPTASSTPFSLEVRLSVHALCNAPWKADAMENACPQVVALYPTSSELIALSTLPADQWPVYPVHVLAYDPAADCIYVREEDGNLGWTNISAVLDATQIEIITRLAPVWQG